MFRKLLILILIIFSSTALADKPKLILQITVDQLRGDMVSRFGQRFGEGGFRYLLDQGVNYTDAHYQHANTETIVGHVSLATGTVPAAQIFRQLPGSKRPKWAALPRASA